MEIQLEVVWPLLLLSTVVLALLFYYYKFWLPAILYNDKQSAFNTTQQGVSVIVAARNESANLQRFLPALLEQDYPDYEVIVVNDCSFDDSADVLMAFQKRYAHLKVVTIEEQPKYPTGKKFALTLGIKAAKHEVLLFTDADSEPASNRWVQLMQQQYLPKTEIVLGRVQQAYRPGLLNALIRYDSLFTSVQFFGHAIARIAYMGQGSNLSYLRSLFFFHKGFVAHIKHPTGDDDLFVNAAATRENVRISLAPESFTITQPKESWSGLWRQKARHMSSSKLYKRADQRWLGLLAAWQWASVLLFAFACWFYLAQPIYLYVAIGVFSLAWLHRYLFLMLFAKKVQENKLWYWLPLVLPLHQLVHIWWGIKGLLFKPKW